MVIIAQRYKSERLKHAPRRRSHRPQHFRHPMNVAGLALNRQFNKVSLVEGASQLQQPASRRDNLHTGIGMISIVQFYKGWRGCKLKASGTMQRVALGIVGHCGITIAFAAIQGEITEAQCPDSHCLCWHSDFYPFFARFCPNSAEGLGQPLNQIGGDQAVLTNA